MRLKINTGETGKESFRNAVLFTLCAMAVLLIAGLWSGGVSLGDEVHHYRFAKNSFWLGHRAVFDRVYGTGEAPGFYYSTDIVWPMGLCALWKVLGGISFAAAQAYHVFFYGVLLLATYRIALKLHDEQTAWWSLFLTATAPMLASFGVLFYVDLPATALAVLAFLLLIEKRYLGFAVVLGLQFLTKRNMLFFIPAYSMIFLYQNRGRKIKAAGMLALCGLPLVALTLWDAYWRSQHLPANISMIFQLLSRIPVLGRHLPIAAPGVSAAAQIQRIPLAQYSNSSIFSISDNLMYFGIPLVGSFLGALFMKKEKQDGYLWLIVVSFLAINFGLQILPDIRYVLPLTPFIAILAARSLVRVSKNELAGALIFALGMTQMVCAAGYTAIQRHQPQEVLEGFRYMRENLPKDALIIYPEVNLVEYAERPMVWGNFDLSLFLGGTDKEKRLAVERAGAQYIAIKKSRIYDDSGMAVKHYGGYPLSLVTWLAEADSFAVPVFENSQIGLWKVNPEKKGDPS